MYVLFGFFILSILITLILLILVIRHEEPERFYFKSENDKFKGFFSGSLMTFNVSDINTLKMLNILKIEDANGTTVLNLLPNDQTETSISVPYGNTIEFPPTLKTGVLNNDFVININGNKSKIIYVPNS